MDRETTKVLICDDSILARKSLHAMIADMGFVNILEVANGQDAIDVCEKEKPELVLLDIVMPIKDGVTATKEIMELCPDTSIIMVSSVGTQTHLTEAIKAGAKDFVQKPVDAELLKQVIGNIE